LKQTIRQAKQVPELVNYKTGKKRFNKRPDAADLALIRKIEESKIPYPVPYNRMPEGSESRRNDEIGLTHVHHFYTRRNLFFLAYLKSRASSFNKYYRSRWNDVFQSICTTLSSRLARYNLGKRGNGPVSGTLYVASLNAETNVFR